MIDAPPATVDAVSAPSSQPDPMMEPRAMNVSPQKPIPRLSSPWCPAGAVRVSVMPHPFVPGGGYPRGSRSSGETSHQTPSGA